MLPQVTDSDSRSAWANDLHLVAGIDEAGRGAFAPDGSLLLQSCCHPTRNCARVSLALRDSKRLQDPAKRDYWAIHLREKAISYGVGLASHAEIDEMGIVPATRLAIDRAISGLPHTPQHLLIDFLSFPELTIPQTCLVKGDARCMSIAAASILAKTTRDGICESLISSIQVTDSLNTKGMAQRLTVKR